MVDTEIYGCDYSSKGYVTSNGDIGCVRDLENVAQQVHNRLRTRLGTYPAIDDGYGSEVHLILGEKNNTQLLRELEVYIQNCMVEEPRVQEVLDLQILKKDKDTVLIELLLQLVDGSEMELTEELEGMIV